jgi:hypothetical protein
LPGALSAAGAHTTGLEKHPAIAGTAHQQPIDATTSPTRKILLILASFAPAQGCSDAPEPERSAR